jgi:hypothetical protein
MDDLISLVSKWDREWESDGSLIYIQSYV